MHLRDNTSAMYAELENSEISQLLNPIASDTLNQAQQRDIRRLRFPHKLEQVFLRYYDWRFRHWFQIGVVIASLLATFTFFFFAFAPPKALSANQQLYELWTSLGMMLVSFVVLGLTYTQIKLEHLQQVMYLFYFFAITITAVQIASHINTDAINEDVLFIFMTLLLVIVVCRGRLLPSLPIMALTVAVPYSIAFITSSQLPSVFHYQILTLFLFALTMGYLLDHDARKDFLNLLIIHRLATMDALCGILNRRQFFLHAKFEVERARRYRHAFSVIVMDIDHFKRINDSFGHAIGDQVLKMVARTCASKIRSTDILARLGGEEFALALPETDGRAATQLAERLRTHLSEAKLNANAEQAIQITASFGVSTFDVATDATLESLLGRADQCLYRAKHSGRNRVVSMTEPVLSV